VIGGFLGAGKTTLVNHLLRAVEGVRLGVIVNDFGEEDVDGELMLGRREDIASVAGRCVCCEGESALAAALDGLLSRPDPPEHLVVETSGVSDPLAVAQALTMYGVEGSVLVDGLVVVADAASWTALAGPDRRWAEAQLKSADFVVLNKVDVATPEARARTREALELACPTARIVEAVRGRVPPTLLLGLGMAPLSRAAPARPSTPGHGYDSFVVELAEPLDLHRLYDELRTLPPSVFRVKGWARLAHDPEQAYVVQVVGRRVELAPWGPWAERPRRTRLVCVGVDAGPAEALVVGRLRGAVARPV
jgi:G3E family GTPase